MTLFLKKVIFITCHINTCCVMTIKCILICYIQKVQIFVSKSKKTKHIIFILLSCLWTNFLTAQNYFFPIVFKKINSSWVPKFLLLLNSGNVLIVHSRFLHCQAPDLLLSCGLQPFSPFWLLTPDIDKSRIFSLLVNFCDQRQCVKLVDLHQQPHAPRSKSFQSPFFSALLLPLKYNKLSSPCLHI